MSGERKAGTLALPRVCFFLNKGSARFSRVNVMPKLLLIDGSNYLFRAYHALPPLTTSTGEPTGAIKGFLGMLSRVHSLAKPDMAAVIFDAPGKTFRHEMYPEYKANRPPMPDDLRVQIEPLEKVVAALGWKVLIVPGIEADDVIGSLSRMAKREGVKSVVATGDKDLSQLVDDDVVILNTMNTKFYDRAGVIEKYGVPPERMIDYLALMGDKVDNVPGIKGCGPKTAAKWVAEFGGINEIRAAAPAMKGKIGENLRAGLPFLDEAVALVTVKCDAEIPGVSSLADLAFGPSDADALNQFSERWEISRTTLARAEALREGAPGAQSAATPAQAGGAPKAVPAAKPRVPAEERPELPTEGEPFPEDYQNPDAIPFTEVTDSDQLDQLVKVLQTPRTEPVAVALLYDGAPRHADFGGFGIAVSPKEVYVAQSSIGLSIDKIAAALKPWFESSAPKIFHDGKSALHALAAQDIFAAGTVDDVRLMDYTLEAHLSHDLEKIARRLLRRKLPTRDEVLGKGAKRRHWREVEPEASALLLSEEAAAIRAAGSVLRARLDADPRLASIYDAIERPLLPVLYRMEAVGITLDAKLLRNESAELGVEIEKLAQAAENAAGRPFNLASPKQLAEILFVEQKIPVIKKTASGSPSTDEEVLSELALDYPLPKIILEHRRLTKLKSTYLDKLPLMIDRDGRVHTTFGQAVAVTGRLASSDPNLQNIPARTPEGRRIRDAFVAQDGWTIVDADYSQVELRIMAHLSQDEGLLSAFARGEDVHRSTASEVFGVPLDRVTPDERRMAKVINFGLIYGMSAFGLAQQLGLDRKVAAAYVERYFQRFPGVRRYMDETRARAAEDGYVETVFGRRLWIPDIRSSRPMVRAGAERAAINAPMQGTAADIIKRAMISVENWIRDEKLKALLLLQVHDELVLEVPEDEVELVKTKLPELMAGAASLLVPLIAEVGTGRTWGESH